MLSGGRLKQRANPRRAEHHCALVCFDNSVEAPIAAMRLTKVGSIASESVRKHQAGLQSFRSMRRIEASRRNASALRLRFSQSFASLRQRLSQAKVRSTTQRRGSATNPFVRSERLTISVSSCGKIFAKAF